MSTSNRITVEGILAERKERDPTLRVLDGEVVLHSGRVDIHDDAAVSKFVMSAAKTIPALSDDGVEFEDAVRDAVAKLRQKPVRPTTDSAVDPLGLTELANCRRLVEQHGVNLRYIAGRGWFVWDGKRFAVDNTGEVSRIARAVVDSLKAEAAAAQGNDFEALAKHYTRSAARRQIEAMIALAESEQKIRVGASDMDRDPWLLNVENGTLELKGEQTRLRPYDRADNITKLVPTEYDPDARCERWDLFVQEVCTDSQGVRRPELETFLQRVIGYMLTGLTAERVLILLCGGGANGKSVLQEVLLMLFGDYGRAIAFDAFLERKNDSSRDFQLAQLSGARFVSASEPNAERRFAEATIKSITGGDTITACHKHKPHFQFKPAFTLMLAANHRPTIRGTDDAIWARIVLIPFERKWKKRHEPGDYPIQDHKLPEKLRAELPGILAWAVRGCVAWQLQGLSPPECVTDAVAEYRDDMDVLADFIQECTRRDTEARTPIKALYDAYRAFCRQSDSFVMGKKKFVDRLVQRGCVRDSDGTARLLRGITLLRPVETDDAGWRWSRDAD